MGGTCCCADSSKNESEFDSGPLRPQRQFNVTVDKLVDEGLGLDVDIGDDVTASITKVLEEGAIPEWNKKSDEEFRVQEGDHIVEVNGVRGTAEKLIATLKADTKLDLVVQRPTEFLAAITKEKGTDCIGLDIGYTKIGTTLLVQKVVTAGCVEKWNEAHPNAAVRKNDRIVEVNGTRGSSTELMKKIKEKDIDKLRLVVTRCE